MPDDASVITALRASYAARQNDIVGVSARITAWPDDLPSGPLNAAALDVVVLPGGGRARTTTGRQWLLVAVAVVIVVITAVVAWQLRSGSKPQSAARPLDVVSGPSCLGPIPEAWRSKVRSISVDFDNFGALQGVTSRGGVVVLYSAHGFGATTVGVVPKGGHKVAALYPAMSGGPGVRAESAKVIVDGDDALLERSVNGDVLRRFTELVAIPTTGGAATVAVRRTDFPGRQFGPGQVFLKDRHVYFVVTNVAGGGTRSLYDHSLSSGRTELITSAPDLYLSGSAAGIGWVANGRWSTRLNGVPEVIANHVTQATFATFRTDGAAWAWANADGSIDWWTSGASHIVRHTGLGRLSSPPTTRLTVHAVAGPLVQYQTGTSFREDQRLLDTRTGFNARRVGFTNATGDHGEIVGLELGQTSLKRNSFPLFLADLTKPTPC